MTTPADFTFIHRLRVRWAEVDGQHVVFNGHYLTYLDVAVTEFWRHAGLPYPNALAFHQGDMFVRRNLIEYHAPARMDDWLDIGLRCDRIGHSSITVAWAIWTQGRLLVTGEVVNVYVDVHTRVPQAVPQGMRDQLDAFARGEALYRVEVGNWATLQAGAAAVRQAVFIDEQGIPESEEWDADDAEAVHAVVSNLAGLPLATGRLIHAGQEPEHAKIGRMAVLRCSRGTGLGEQVLRALMGEARRRQLHGIALHAQVNAQGFYEKLGFVAEGPVFDEVGMPHQRMVIRL